MRINVLQQIYSELAKLGDEREEARINDLPTDYIDNRIKDLRIKLNSVMNNKCPVLNLKNN